MKQFCLVPRAIVERYSPSSATSSAAEPPRVTPVPMEERVSATDAGGGQDPPRRAASSGRAPRGRAKRAGARPVFYYSSRKGQSMPSLPLPLARPKTRAPSPVSRPSLELQLPAFFSDTLLPYASALMNYYRNQSLLQWDETGNITAPFSGLNIIDAITVFSKAKGGVPKSQKPMYRMLQSFAPIPLSYIKNISLKSILKGTSRAGAMKIKQWKPY